MRDQIFEKIKLILDGLEVNVDGLTPDSQLIGSSAILDSMKLVELCLELEDLSEQYNFDFDWSSETAMSKNRSIFKNLATLIDEFIRQKDAS